MGNSCIRIEKPVKMVQNSIERSFRHSKSSYQCNDYIIEKSDELDSSKLAELLTVEITNDLVSPQQLTTENTVGGDLPSLTIGVLRSLDEHAEILENITRALMKAKVAIDGCTYDESRHRFHYSIVPFLHR